MHVDNYMKYVDIHISHILNASATLHTLSLLANCHSIEMERVIARRHQNVTIYASIISNVTKLQSVEEIVLFHTFGRQDPQ